MPRDADRNEHMYVESLNLLAANELALESLYLEYARQHTHKAAFWQELAAEEHRHADWVKKLAGDVRLNTAAPGRFRPEAIRTFTEYLTEQEAAARRGEVPFKKAVVTAFYIEGALIEQKFFEQLPVDDSRLKSILSALKRETEQHARKIEDALNQLRKD